MRTAKYSPELLLSCSHQCILDPVGPLCFSSLLQCASSPGFSGSRDASTCDSYCQLKPFKVFNNVPVHRQSVLLFKARNIFASGLQAVHRHEQVFIEVSRCPSHCKSQGQHIQNHAFIPALGMTKGQNLLHTCCSPKAWPRDKPPWQLNSEASETMQCHKCSIGK